MFSLAPLGERGNRKAVGEGVGTNMQNRVSVGTKRQDLDFLTRLAPADESAGCESPSPPRGRGLKSHRECETPGVAVPGRRPIPGAFGTA